MQDALIQVKVENQLKSEAVLIYSQLGLDLPTAIRIFLKASIYRKGLPFDLNLKEDFPVRKRSVKSFFGSMDEETYEEMVSALKDCSQVDENEW